MGEKAQFKAGDLLQPNSPHNLETGIVIVEVDSVNALYKVFWPKSGKTQTQSFHFMHEWFELIPRNGLDKVLDEL